MNIPYYLLRRLESTKSPVCGLAMLNPGWRHMRRCLETESVLIIGKKGHALIEDNGNTFEISEGKMLLLPAGHIHRGIENVRQPLSYWWFHFYQCLEVDDELRIYLPKIISPADAEERLSGKIFDPELKNGIILPQSMELSNFDIVSNICSQTLLSFSSGGNSNLIYNNSLESLLLELGAQSQANITAAEKKEGKSRLIVKKILELLENELSNPNSSVKYFADALGVNADYLGRCFKKEMSISLGQYINKRRIELSCMRLRENNSTMEEIAFECGFGSRRQFFDEFKKRTGKTPALYRSESAYVGINSL